MTGYYILPWTELAATLRSRTEVPAAQAAADLLDAARPTWEHRAVADLAMHDLVFAPHGQEPPFSERVLMSWSNDVYEFQLRDGLKLVTADRCTPENCNVVLDAFLSQLIHE